MGHFTNLMITAKLQSLRVTKVLDVLTFAGCSLIFLINCEVADRARLSVRLALNT